ncbi:helix-turn-helix transcriptional regulator [Mucilaginibacter mali]|uniref:Helix-turn-helix transcriptional regulator n=1 Tax=Mucilaginibacter mali TaxID=2740462 RepID=A0A7D4TXW7_9SPHI|nr:helix-turn-helix transcriptional regulator [Mucilaginibacter mali]QKJ30737.1 helix-turn-helix transcriptional regulator [Mucilaginibacter mali]
MKRYLTIICISLLMPVLSYGQQARLVGKVSLDGVWARKVYISRLPRFDDMFTASRALIVSEGDIDTAGNFSVSFPADATDALYRLHFIRQGDPVSTLLIGSNDVNHVFFIARQAYQIHFTKKAGKPINQSDISGSKANAELNALLKLAANDTTGNNAFITVAAKSTSQLVGLLAISHTTRQTDRQRKDLQDILSRYDTHNAYGAAIFKDYRKENHWALYLIAEGLLIAGSLLYGLRFYKRQALLKVWRELSQREKDIAGLILSGKPNKEVAMALNIELSTVKTHVNNIYAKLKVSGRKDLDRYKDMLKK